MAMIRTTSSAVLLAMACAGLAGCGGSGSVAAGPARPAGSLTVTLLGDAAQLDQKSVAGSCVQARAWDGSLCRTFAVRSSERAPTPFESVARYFVERGWLVAFPQRRGRGTSDGLYVEGFTPDRSRYSCLRAPTLSGHFLVNDAALWSEAVNGLLRQLDR